MFGALNRLISRLDGDPQEQHSDTGGAFGFQILKNVNDHLPLEPWFDFIIGINGRTLDSGDPNLFATEVRNCAGSTVSLGVWTAKGQRIREIYFALPQDNPTLGITLQWSPLSGTEDVWHILDVAPNSPADLAGLLPYGDYVIGSPEAVIRGESGLGELVEHHLDRPLRLLVYNHEYNVTRHVDITPSRSWGGQGALGCTLGFGALHRIPPTLEEPPHAPGETMFETPSDEKHALSSSPGPVLFSPPSNTQSPVPPGEFLVPADMIKPNSRPSSTGPPKRERKVRAHNFAVPALEIDEYFKEGEAKSREQDHAPPPKAGSNLPPPPKSGGPPKAAASSPDM
ncbi:hypothetical protein EJ06DRAFT_477627 [Trichodelitschia bisporula]|uniref:PDZ GRASP-type domain-containing protein n=1 Tax=Trichodelitschia bisporula TaxID=703511 RepID=A0A6G1HV42_9PEZI|nr:hypothetical protein EJ06DRAFT_477627 [Trichodelitschia bisporula]